MAVSSAICTSFKKELFKGVHDFSATGGDVFKIALFVAAASVVGTHGAATTNYSEMGADEHAAGSGYTAGGATLTNVEPDTSGTTAFIDFADPSWSSATLTTSGAEIYNSSAANAAVAVFSFGGDQSLTNGTFTLQMPTADATNAIIRLA